MNKRRLGNVALVILSVVVAVMLLSLLAGYRFGSVRSGSMAPEMGIGDLVITGPAGANDIKPGDIISYRAPSGEMLICHRVVSVDQGAGHVQTKGDANEYPDLDAVPFTSIVGKVVFHIPLLGYIVSFLGSLYGLAIIALAGMSAYLYSGRSGCKMQNEGGGWQ